MLNRAAQQGRHRPQLTRQYWIVRACLLVSTWSLASCQPAASGPLLSHRGSPFSVQPPYKLCIGSVFKNEADNLAEWVVHHAAEGVDHFYLVDNNSTDAFGQVLEPFIKAGWLSLWTDPRRHSQMLLTEHYFHPVSWSCEWFAILDLDEFVYARDMPSITSYLQHVPPDVGSIVLPWKMFGSSGHASQPPGGVVAGFTKRKVDSNTPVKSISRSRSVQDFSDYHSATLLPGFVKAYPTPGPAPQVVQGLVGRSIIPEEELQTHELHINHYGIQSKDWYQRVKMPRGDNQHSNWDTGRNMQHFYDLDFAEMDDNELKHRRRDRRNARERRGQ